MIRDILSLVAITLTFGLFVPYIRSILRGATRPHVFSWIIWGLVTLVVCFAQLAGGAGFGAWAIGVSGAITCYIAGLAWRHRGDTAITRSDWFFLVTALTALPAWYLTADPLWAVVILTTIDLLGFGPTIRRLWTHPHEENATFFALVAVRNFLVVCAVERLTLTTILFPAAVGAACLLVVALLLLRRRALSKR